MPPHAQYLANLSEICTTERSAHWRRKIVPPPSYKRLDLPPLQLLEHFPFVLLGSS